MNQYLKMSLDGFNGSKYCDRNSAEAFYSSYIRRKQTLIAKKLNAQSPINSSKLWWENESLNRAIKSKTESIKYINFLLNKPKEEKPDQKLPHF